SVFIPKSNLNIESGNTMTVTLNIDDIKNTDSEICTLIPAVVQNNKYIPIINHTDTIYTVNTPYKSLFVNSLGNIQNIIDTIYADNFKITKLNNYTIHIDALNINYPVKVFDFGGTMIYCGLEEEIKLPAPGFYVVKNGKVNKSLIINN
ncbi:MAG: hypothetical protein K2J97_01895, partial [Muribaculaceae bacterium]|nr:hypothetical protein [Muribaculaceae bacterium]